MCSQCLNQTVHLGFTEEEFSAGAHICFIYNDDDERRAITIQFLAAAFQYNETVVFFADRWDKDQLKDRLSDNGVDVSAAEDSGQLTISDVEAVYYPEGTFTAEEMWQRLRDAYDTSIEAGYKGWRGSGEMSWALNDIPGNDQLIRYEYGLNNEMLDRPFTAICQYDANLFSGAMLMEVLRVHPYMIARGKVVSNPHFQGMGK